MATLMSDILDSVLSIEKLKDEITGYMHGYNEFISSIPYFLK